MGQLWLILLAREKEGRLSFATTSFHTLFQSCDDPLCPCFTMHCYALTKCTAGGRRDLPEGKAPELWRLVNAVAITRRKATACANARLVSSIFSIDGICWACVHGFFCEREREREPISPFLFYSGSVHFSGVAPVPHTIELSLSNGRN